jgi:hypothetical protein
VALEVQIKQARQRQNDMLLERALNSARLVISGAVIGITAPEGRQMIMSQRDPQWKLAEVRVDETLKGKTDNKTVQVLFPSGNDVMYFRWPRLTVGEEGVFLIQQADSLTVRLTHCNNVASGPFGFMGEKGSVLHIRDLITRN